MSGLSDREDVSAVLEGQRAEVTARLGELRAGFDGLVAASDGSNADDEHDPEGATIAFERAQLTALIAHAEDLLVEIDLALRRIAEGRYGRCEVCDRTIAPERLAARPIARTCIDCAAKR